MNRSVRALALLALLALTAGVGCHGSMFIYVEGTRYIPNLSAADLTAYRDRPVLLNEFVNEAENTSNYYYYSPDGTVTYEGDPYLVEFLRDCFAKAMSSVGMVVLTEPPPAVDPAMPDLTVTAVSWDDAALDLILQLNRNGQPAYEQEYRVEVQRIVTSDPKILEDRAYRIMDMVVAGVLADPGFQAAFFQ